MKCRCSDHLLEVCGAWCGLAGVRVAPLLVAPAAAAVTHGPADLVHLHADLPIPELRPEEG